MLEIVKKEFIQVLRDPRMRFVLFIPPIAQTILFGYAINMDVKNISIAWVDMDHTPASQDLLAAFRGSKYFNVEYVLEKEEDTRYILDRGKAKAVVRILPGFSQQILRNRNTGLQILIDGTDSNTASIISNYIHTLIANYSTSIIEKKGGTFINDQGSEGVKQFRMGISKFRFEDRVWFNPELKSRYYFVTGVIVNIIALVTIMLTAMVIVREKEIGTMEQLMVTPIRPIELILGKTLPFALVGLVDVALITIAAMLIFRIPFRGSFLMLFVASVLFLQTTLGTGLFISTISQTQQQALMTNFFFMMPAIMLSGFAFPIRNMPLAVQYLTYLNPLRYFIEILRGVFLKGTGFSILYPQLFALLVLGIVVMASSVLRFHKRLD